MRRALPPYHNLQTGPRTHVCVGGKISPVRVHTGGESQDNIVLEMKNKRKKKERNKDLQKEKRKKITNLSDVDFFLFFCCVYPFYSSSTSFSPGDHLLITKKKFTHDPFWLFSVIKSQRFSSYNIPFFGVTRVRPTPHTWWNLLNPWEKKRPTIVSTSDCLPHWRRKMAAPGSM